MKGLMWTDTEMTIGEYRKPTADELKNYADWYKQVALFGVDGTPTIELKYFSWRDLETVFGERKADGSIPGCNNRIWTLSDTEYQEIMRIETERAAQAEAKEATEKAGSQNKIDNAVAQAKATGKPVEIKRYMVDCQGGEIDCSFDLCIISVDGDGKQHKQFSHCY
jgi:hypothetical protein